MHAEQLGWHLSREEAVTSGGVGAEQGCMTSAGLQPMSMHHCHSPHDVRVTEGRCLVDRKGLLDYLIQK